MNSHGFSIKSQFFLCFEAYACVNRFILRRVLSSAYCLLHDDFLLGFFDPESWGDIFLWNVGWFLANYTTSYGRRYNSSKPRCEKLRCFKFYSRFTSGTNFEISTEYTPLPFPRTFIRLAYIYWYICTVNNFVDCGFVAPYNKILTYTYTYPHPPSK
jgi:hypothetical protein